MSDSAAAPSSRPEPPASDAKAWAIVGCDGSIKSHDVLGNKYEIERAVQARNARAGMKFDRFDEDTWPHRPYTCEPLYLHPPSEALVRSAVQPDTDDTARLDFLLADATLAPTEDGDLLGLFLGTSEKEIAALIVAEAEGDGEESFTADDVPFLTEQQRGDINGTRPDSRGYVDDPAAIRKAIDFLQRDPQAAAPPAPEGT